MTQAQPSAGKSPPGHYLLGCDIGGTFTDFVLLDVARGRFAVHKTLTTPHDPSQAVEQGVADLLARFPGFLAHTDFVIHGTTLVINAIIERKGAALALVTTAGFRDVLEMRREIRYDIYDIGARYPEPLVPREWRRELPERVYSDGQVATPLDEAAAASLLDELAAAGIESLAVCFLHAYANPANEQALARVAARRQPGLSLSLSSQVLPEIKEFERTSTTAVNAYVKPITERYLARLQERLARLGLRRRLFLMLSGGGVTALETARQFPVRLIESGPVGGVLAAAHLGRQAGLGNLVVFDLGGTTAKTCLVQDGQMPIATEYEIDRVHRFKKGSGIPVGVPTVDLIEVGAGGGSIAGIDRMGLLQVGPQSAGADPGPICYARGGTAPTVTDADLVLGYLDADYFLGGGMRLDRAAAEAGIARVVGGPLGLSPLQAAWGIHEVVNENMAAAVRMFIAEKGGDLSQATLVASGGAGPVHADGFARKLGIPRLLVPRGAGVFSALGFLVAPVSFEVSRTRVTSLAQLEPAVLRALYDELEREAGAVVAEALPEAPLSYVRAADLCYAGQGHTLRVTFAEGAPTPAVEALGTRFEQEYRSRYGYAYEDLDVQLINLRVTAVARSDLPPVALPFDAPAGNAAAALKGERPAYDPLRAERVPHRVYAMERLGPGATLHGPAIVEDAMSTLVVGARAQARVDARGWMLVNLDGS